VAGDERDELDETRRRLGQVETVLGDAQADALVALEAATDEVGRQEARLAIQVRGPTGPGASPGWPWSAGAARPSCAA